MNCSAGPPRGENRYIIEDDYDCEFRLAGRPIPTLQSIDVMEKVIYINTFSKSLAPAFRISYLVLARHLVTRFYETLGFYSGTVSCLEQMTLARFLAQGYFEKHINRMRNHYRALQDKLLAALRQSPGGEGEDQRGSRRACISSWPWTPPPRRGGHPPGGRGGWICASPLSPQYYFSAPNRLPHVLVMNYSGLEEGRWQSGGPPVPGGIGEPKPPPPQQPKEEVIIHDWSGRRRRRPAGRVWRRGL